MTLLSSDIRAFSDALADQAIICTSNGYWTQIPDSVQRCHALIGKDYRRLNKIAKVFMGCLDDLEKLPVSSKLPDNEIASYIEAGEQVVDLLEKDGKKTKRYSERLKSRIVALKARSGHSSGESLDSETVSKVHELASSWKLGSYIMGNEDLDAFDFSRLKKIEKYQGFVEQLVTDEDLRSRFFDWTLRDRIDPEPFIHFPAKCQQLSEARLSHRIGFYGGKQLKVVKSGEGRVDLTLPIGGKEVSMLDDRLVVDLGEGYSQTVGQIIETFFNRQWDIGDIEYFKDGIRNWNPKKLGPWIPEEGVYRQVYSDQERYWEELPVVEEISKEEAEERFSLELDGAQWIMAIRASREENNDTPANTHGWLQVGVPVNGKYRLFDFGKYTDGFPRPWYGAIDVITNPLPGVITYPDESIFTLDRRHAWQAVATSPEEGEALFKSIKEDLENVDDGNFAFQLLSDNCLKWAWNRVNDVVGDEKMPPEVAQINFSDLEPGGLLRWIFKALRKLPFEIRWLILTSIVTLFGAWKKMKIRHLDGTIEKVSLLSHLPWGRGEKSYSPGQIFRFNDKKEK